MGIRDLLKMCQPLIKKISLSKLKGKTAGIDMMGWLYKGLYASMNINGTNSTLYLNYPLKMLTLLQNYGIKFIVVFDGQKLKAKTKKLEQRENNFSKNFEFGTSLLNQGLQEESTKIFKRTLKIKPIMVNSLIEILRKMNINFIVSPYEADAQLAFLYQTHQIDFAITEDADLIPFGVKHIGYKIDQAGSINYLDLTDTPSISELTPIAQFILNVNRLKLVQFCVLLGCDYLESPKGLGMHNCYNYFTKYNDLDQIIKMMKYSLKFHFEEDLENEENKEDYLIKAKKATSVFFLQTIYDNLHHKLSPICSLDYDREKDNIETLTEKNWLKEVYESVEDKTYYGGFFDEFEDYCNGLIDSKTMLKEKTLEENSIILQYYYKFSIGLTYPNNKEHIFNKKTKYITLYDNYKELDIDQEIKFLELNFNQEKEKENKTGIFIEHLENIQSDSNSSSNQKREEKEDKFLTKKRKFELEKNELNEFLESILSTNQNKNNNKDNNNPQNIKVVDLTKAINK